MTGRYRRDLALVHHLGFAFHANACAPGILRLLQPVRARNGLVLELGCGSGALTRHLVAAGHRVVATDASSEMIELACQHAPGSEDVRVLALPDEPLPAADATSRVPSLLREHGLEATVGRRSARSRFRKASSPWWEGGWAARDSNPAQKLKRLPLYPMS